MDNSVLVLYIILGDRNSTPEITAEVPSIGLFRVNNVIRNLGEWALVYSTDKIRGRDADKIRCAQGFLPTDGISSINENADFKLGGGIALQNSTNFKLKNTSALKEQLESYEVDITGRQVYVIEYSWNEPSDPATIDSQTIEANPLFAGRADAVAWGETILSFSAVPTFEAQRRANLSIDGLPVTFGNLFNGFNKRYGTPKSIPLYVFTGREEDRETYVFDVWRYREFPYHPSSYTGQLFQEVQIELTSTAPNYDLNFSYRLNEFNVFFKEVSATNLHPYYVDAKKGGGDCYLINEDNGEGVPVLLEQVITNSMGTVTAYPYELVGFVEPPNPVVPAAIIRLAYPFQNGVPTRVRLVRADVYFQGDGWSSREGYNEDITHASNSYVRRVSDEERRVLPVFWQPPTDNPFWVGMRGRAFNYYEKYQVYNAGDINVPDRYALFGLGELADKDASKTFSRVAFTESNNVSLYRQSLRILELERGEWSEYRFIAPGVYKGPPPSGYPSSSGTASASLSLGPGPNITTVTTTATGPTGLDFLLAVSIALPPRDPAYIVGDRAYLMTMIGAHSAFDRSLVQRLLVLPNNRRGGVDIGSGVDFFREGTAQIVKIQSYHQITYPLHSYISDPRGVYDAFHSGIIADRSPELLPVNSDDLDDLIWYNPTDIMIGYRNFEISGIDTKSSIGSTFIFLANIELGQYNEVTEIYDSGILYEDDVDITNGILLETRGRILLKDLPNRITGQSRLNSNGVRQQINNPVLAIEHVMRLSNWSETATADADTAYSAWGKEYAPTGYSELIDTDSFDSPALAEQRGTPISAQIISPDDADNYAIARSLCKEFYIGMNNRLPSDYSVNGASTPAWFGTVTMPHAHIFSLDTPADPNTVPVITLKHLMKTVEIKEPSAPDVYCEPIFKYCYVEGLGYTKEIAVNNINMPKWASGYTRGLRTGLFGINNDARRIWNMCKKIFNKYKSFKPQAETPTELVEHNWIGDYGQELTDYNSISYANALKKLKKILQWAQMQRTSITVPWDVGRLWGIGTHIKLSVPHVSQGEPVLCVVETIQKNRYRGDVVCGLILIEYLEDADAPLITSFEYYPIPLYEDSETVTLRWTTENADTVEIVGFGTGLSPNDELTLTIGDIAGFEDGYTFTIIARGVGGEATETLTVTVGEVMLLMGSLYVSPNTVYSTTGSGTVSVRWTVLNALAATLNGEDVALVEQNGIPFTISETTTFVLYGYSNWNGSVYLSRGSLTATATFVAQQLPNFVTGNVVVEDKTFTARIYAALNGQILSGSIGPRRPVPIIPTPPNGVMAEGGTFSAYIYADLDGPLLEGSIGDRYAGKQEIGVMNEIGFVTAFIDKTLTGSIGDRYAGKQEIGVMNEIGFVTAFIDKTLTGSIGPRYS